MVQKNKGEQTRQRILKKTRELLVSQGYYATSISSIIEATGVKKGNLYYHFASKEELGLAVLDDAAREFAEFIEESLDGENPLEEILNSAESVLKILEEKNFTGGCLFGNTALEMSDSNRKFASIIREVFSTWTTAYENKIAEAKAQGLLPGSMAPPLLARTVVALLEGWIMMIRVSKSETDVEDCLLALEGLLKE